jgi:ABC-2 type transport system ATP-binding protein
MLACVPALEIHDLVVRRSGRTIVAGLDLTAQPGQVTALVGPNGAGKTTTVETCVGLRRPFTGSIELLGARVPVPRKARLRLQEDIGIMLQDGGLYSTARPLEMVRHIAAMHANPDDPATLLDALGIDPTTRTTLRRMSGGEQRRVSAAAALVGRPRLAFLDEPTTGLDAAGRRSFHDLVRQRVADGVTFVLTTHLMDDVERLADHVVVMAAGRNVAQGSITELVGSDDSVSFRGPMHMNLDELRTALPAECTLTEAPPGHYRVTGSLDPMVLAAVAAWCGQHGVPTGSISVGRRSLDEIVMALVDNA